MEQDDASKKSHLALTPYQQGIPHLAITRRHLLQTGTLAAITPALGAAAGIPAIERARAQSAGGEPVWRHALSTFGDIKYPADFKRFDYVNPDAPKGGVIRLFEAGTFDNFNIVIDGLKGSLASGAAMILQTL